MSATASRLVTASTGLAGTTRPVSPWSATGACSTTSASRLRVRPSRPAGCPTRRYPTRPPQDSGSPEQLGVVRGRLIRDREAEAPARW